MRKILALTLCGLTVVGSQSFAQARDTKVDQTIQTRDYNIVVENKDADIRLSLRVPNEINETAYTTTKKSVTYPHRCEMTTNANETPQIVEKTVMYAPAAITVTRQSVDTVTVDFTSTLLEGLNDFSDGPCKISVAKWKKVSIRETLPLSQETPYVQQDWTIRSTKMLAPIGLDSIN